LMSSRASTGIVVKGEEEVMRGRDVSVLGAAVLAAAATALLHSAAPPAPEFTELTLLSQSAHCFSRTRSGRVLTAAVRVCTNAPSSSVIGLPRSTLSVRAIHALA
jgi:hypothetical protein